MGNETPSITSQEATVLLASGEQLQVTLANPDLARWDMTRHQHKWPTMEEAPVLWATFVTWAAARRLKLTEVKFEAWRDEVCMEVDMPQAAQEEVDPTR